MRAWSENKTGWQILWASQHGVWHEGSITRFREPTRCSSWMTLISTTISADRQRREQPGPARDNSSCSSAHGRAEWPRSTVSSRDWQTAPLWSGSRSFPRSACARPSSLRKKSLARTTRARRRRLAEVSKDTPLITVVGGKLIARGEIIPDLLLNRERFRSEVFNKFLEERTGELPSSELPNSVLLALVAALQPVDPDKDDFVAKASVFLSLRPDQVHDGLDFLEGREVLIRVGSKLRIVPDLFADYFLELASIYPDGRPKGYADPCSRSLNRPTSSTCCGTLGNWNGDSRGMAKTPG